MMPILILKYQFRRQFQPTSKSSDLIFGYFQNFLIDSSKFKQGDAKILQNRVKYGTFSIIYRIASFWSTLWKVINQFLWIPYPEPVLGVPVPDKFL